MYVSIRHYDGVKFPDEVATKVRTEFLPIISKIPGFYDYYAIKTGNDTMTSVSVFKDKPGADESVQSAMKWTQKNMARHFPNAAKVIRGEVVAHTNGKIKKSAA